MSMQNAPGDAGAAAGERSKLGGGAIATIVGLAALGDLHGPEHRGRDDQVPLLGLHVARLLLVLVAALVGALVWFGLGVLRRHRRRQERRDDR